MKRHIIAACIALGLTVVGPSAQAQDERFDIVRFEVKGNTLLPADQINALVAPFIGRARVYGDIQKALEALENAYRAKGFGTVNVHVPEQEITTGVIRLDVSEAVLGKIALTGNRHFDEANIRASLPNLREGTAPNLRQISENVQLINENPAKQVEVTLGTSAQEGKVDAKVALTEQNPRRVYATLDNSGTIATGRHRLGIAYQDANLLGRDEMLTLAYTTTPDVWFDYPDHVKMDVYSIAFRKPFYDFGDSLDVIYGNSNLNTPTLQATGFGINGKGEVLAVRWNHLFPRQGEYTSRLVFGFDYKHMNTKCRNPATGSDFSIAPPTPANSSCVPYTLRPVSATYTGNWQGVGYQAGLNVGVAYNLFPHGSRYTGNAGTAAAGKTDYYSFIAGRPVSDEFMIVRYGGNYARLLNEWQWRAALSGQHTGGGLPGAEQFSLTGSGAVRGFDERAIAADTGYVVNLEAYTPNLAGLVRLPGNLHGVFFHDFGKGRNAGLNDTPFDHGIASLGIGLRYAPDKNFSLSIDAADILDYGPNRLDRRNGWGGHFKMMIAF
ncbi:MAG: ShlB/FhaC/HecB family hemolysin secretion/activation protein [Rhodocyclaceae bacterium]|nr:ShlB/FhaC/HecB family hemolysin secretion/activation protein [Rhodocyclaceae bacterium]MDZ4215664.1 ShlB/FhaC/HecB family hemolysin secretion/activation protein [Rhodocyclaceae bacterium]